MNNLSLEVTGSSSLDSSSDGEDNSDDQLGDRECIRSAKELGGDGVGHETYLGTNPPSSSESCLWSVVIRLLFLFELSLLLLCCCC